MLATGAVDGSTAAHIVPQASWQSWLIWLSQPDAAPLQADISMSVMAQADAALADMAT
jgi:hypothetical protein